MTDVTPVEALTMLGGVASRSRLDGMCTRPTIEAALGSGEIVRVTRSLYRLPDVDRALRLAAELRGRLAVLSAAQAHGWEVAQPPDKPWVLVERSRHASSSRVHLVWGEAEDHDDGLVTSRRRTAVDCARRLPFRDALCVLDSALRHGLDHETLVADAHAVRGKGAAAARRVAALATAEAANPFESMLRALAVEAGLEVRAQVEIEVPDVDSPGGTRTVRPDVVDRERRLVLEADSWQFHAGKEEFQTDCWRYTALVVEGWTVLRFTWWQVMHHPEWVVACLRAVALRGAA